MTDPVLYDYYGCTPMEQPNACTLTGAEAMSETSVSNSSRLVEGPRLRWAYRADVWRDHAHTKQPILQYFEVELQGGPSRWVDVPVVYLNEEEPKS